MSEQALTEPETELTPKQAEAAELKSLKDKANLIGLRFHPKIGLKKLREKVNNQLNKSADELAADAKNEGDTIPLPLR